MPSGPAEMTIEGKDTEREPLLFEDRDTQVRGGRGKRSCRLWLRPSPGDPLDWLSFHNVTGPRPGARPASCPPRAGCCSLRRLFHGLPSAKPEPGPEPERPPARGGAPEPRRRAGDAAAASSAMEAEAGGLEELTDEEMAALGKEELVRRLRREEAARLAALVQRGRLMQEVNRQLQGHLGEIRELKQLNRRLQAENRELRDLCCFLDSERQRGRRAARQWQLFGTQASRAVREDLGGCWQKLAELEGRQEELLRENLALKELCLALGEEWGPRGGPGGAVGSGGGPTPELALPPCGPRDLGDGSSSTGSVGSPDQLPLACSPDD